MWCCVVYNYPRPTFRPLINAGCVCVEMGANRREPFGLRLRLQRVVWPGGVSAIVLDAQIAPVQSGFPLQPLDFGVEGRGQVCDQGLDVAHLMLNR